MTDNLLQTKITGSSSVWQNKMYFNNFFKSFFVFHYKSKTGFDLFLYSYIYKKFLNNYTYNHNYPKVYNKMLNIFMALNSSYKIKGFFLLSFLFFNIIFSSFFETTNVRVAGRSLKVPNPVMFNKSYRVVPKTLSTIIRKKSLNTIFLKIKEELDFFDQENSSLLVYEKNKLNEVVDNRMFEHFRWKYTKLKGSVNRLNP
jgi:hypothetical protein